MEIDLIDLDKDHMAGTKEVQNMFARFKNPDGSDSDYTFWTNRNLGKAPHDLCKLNKDSEIESSIKVGSFADALDSLAKMYGSPVFN